MEEKWKAIEKYEGFYEVSNLGKVRSINRLVTYTNGKKANHRGNILKQTKAHNGYLRVCLSKNNEKKSFQVHSLVAKAFVPKPKGKNQVNHLNEIKTDNRHVNLNWLTAKENINYGTGIERRAKSRGVKVSQLSKSGDIVKVWPSMSEAGRHGFDFRNIYACCIGRQKSHRGYRWQYV